MTIKRAKATGNPPPAVEKQTVEDQPPASNAGDAPGDAPALSQISEAAQPFIKLFGQIVSAITGIKNILQASLLTLVILCLLALQVSREEQQLPSMLVFAIVPFILVISLIGRLKQLYQFWIIILICSSSLCFIALSASYVHWKSMIAGSSDFENFGALMKTLDQQEALDHQFMDPIEGKLTPNTEYAEFQSLILTTYENLDAPLRQKVNDDIVALVKTFDNALSCEAIGRCSHVAIKSDANSRIFDFWYNYRPIIERLRAGTYGPEFAIRVQARALEVKLAYQEDGLLPKEG